MKKSILLYAAVLLLAGCSKVVDSIVAKGQVSAVSASQFHQFTISTGQHSADKSSYKAIETGELNFAVKFDSSAVYQTKEKRNQYDINKLYGFSDNHAAHHQYSARFGWRWSDGALCLFAYVYNEGNVDSEEIGVINIGEEIRCSIKVSEKAYLFSANGITITMQRNSTTPMAKGYLLYPYFGGDETAPHEVRIWIKSL